MRRREAFAEALERLEGYPGDSMERFDRYMASSTAALDGGWPLAIEERWDWQTVASVLRSTAGSLRSTPARLTSEQRTDQWVQDHGSSRQPPSGLGGSE